MNTKMRLNKFSMEYSVAIHRATQNWGTQKKIIKKLEDESICDRDELKAPVTINNLTGHSMTYSKIIDEEEKKSAFGINVKEPEKVYRPIRVEFEAHHYAIDWLDISKLH